MSRRLARQMALQTLFQLEFSQNTVDDAFGAVQREQEEKVTKNSTDYAGLLINGILSNKEKIDELVSSYAKDWDISRLNKVDLSILRTAIYEMDFAEELISPNIAINEAVEIAKLYGDDESPRFINGILGKIAKASSKKDVPRN